jgi:hypothetical protein
VRFTDADTWFEPEFLDAVVGSAEARGLSLLSIYLDPDHRGVVRRRAGPVRAGLFSVLFGTPVRWKERTARAVS